MSHTAQDKDSRLHVERYHCARYSQMFRWPPVIFQGKTKEHNWKSEPTNLTFTYLPSDKVVSIKRDYGFSSFNSHYLYAHQPTV